MSKDEKIKRKVIRVTMLGDSAVGKTSIINSFLGEQFSDVYLTTIGKDKLKKEMKMKDGQTIKIIIWDTAGQERFHSLAANTIKGAHGIGLTFDLTRKSTFDNLQIWLKDIKEINDLIPIVLFGNKCDIIEKRQVTDNDVKTFLNENKFQYFETSAKMNINIEQGFNTLAEMSYEASIGDKSEVDLENPKKKTKNKFC
jgi:small GTP-binding protein